MIKQNFFKFNFDNIQKEFNFYVNSTNSHAYNIINNNNNNNIFLEGPKKSGKSILAAIWVKNNNSIYFNKNFNEVINCKKNVCIKNINKNINEENLFHIINHCKLYNLNILITSNLNINNIDLKLKDLKSRLKTFVNVKINNPDDDMLLNILTKLFIDKQFIINSDEIFGYILKRANRSYEEMFYIVHKLDHLSLEKKRQLTIPLIKEIL